MDQFLHSFFHSIKPWFLVIALASTCFIFWTSKKIRNKAFTILGILFATYVIGKALQVNMIGPRFIRWHLADVGFIPTFAYVILVYDYAWFGFFTKRTTQQALKATYFGAYIAIFLEIFMIGVGIVYNKPTGGDPIDLMIFLVMYFVTLHYVKEFGKFIDDLYAKVEQEIRQERKKVAKARRRASQPPS
jgi:uncharacterized membrane protein